MSTRPEPRWIRFAPLAAAVLAAAVYAGSLANGFVFDDRYIVVENPLVTGETEAWRIPLSHYWAGHDTWGSLYRPLTIATYRLNRLVLGTSAWGFHLVNVLLHAAVTLVLWKLLVRLGLTWAGTMAAALIFATHPVHSEAVVNIVGRAELLAALFVLLAWLLRDRPWVSAALFACGLFSKEIAVALPALLLLEDLLAPAARSRRGRVRLRVYLPHLLVLGLFVAARTAVIGVSIESPAGPFVGVPVWNRILTAVAVLGRYLWIHVYPVHLSADYSYDQIPLAADMLELRVLAGAAATLALLAAAWSVRRSRPGIALGVLWFFVALAPVSNLPFGIGVMMAERLVYLPSAGLCAAAGETIAILAASAARRIGRGAPGRSWPVPGVTLLMAALPAALFAQVSADRTRVWRDELTLWETTCRNSPRSALAHVNLGSVHQYLGRLEDAEAAYRRAIMIAPNRPGPYYNLATVMEATDRPEDAIRMYREAIRVEPFDVKARNNLGRRLLAQGRSQEAIPVLEEALAIEPTALHAAINLGGAYLHQGDLARADRIATDVLASRPGEPGALRLKAAIDAARRKVESPQGRAGAVAP